MTKSPNIVIIPIQQQRSRERRRQNIITLAALAILITAWLVGAAVPSEDVSPFVQSVIPDSDRIESLTGGLYIGYTARADGTESEVGYAMAGQSVGYGGPVVLLVGTNTQGTIVGVRIVSHQETPNFFRLLERQNFTNQFVGKGYEQNMTLGDDLDGVSGATLSAEAVAQSIRLAIRSIANRAISDAVIPPDNRPIRFGAPEAALLALFIISFFLHRLKHHPKLKNWGRWVMLIGGLLTHGFMFNKPLTLANIVTLLSGAWPDWQTNLYWFLLLGGIFTVTLIQGKNPYCSWFCPFGAAQEILGSLTGAKAYQPRQWYNRLRWVQRGLAFTAIVLGLALRQPGAVSYEPFGTLFNLQGSWPQWVLLILVLFGSLVMYRPFCTYLCPLDPVVDYIGEGRRVVKKLWQQRRNPTA